MNESTRAKMRAPEHSPELLARAEVDGYETHEAQGRFDLLRARILAARCGCRFGVILRSSIRAICEARP